MNKTTREQFKAAYSIIRASRGEYVRAEFMDTPYFVVVRAQRAYLARRNAAAPKASLFDRLATLKTIKALFA